MLNVQGILNAKVLTDPWPHQEIVQVADPTEFEQIKSIYPILVEAVKQNPQVETGFNLNQLSSLGISYDVVELLVSLADQFLEIVEDILIKYPNARRSDTGYFCTPRIIITAPQGVNPIHDEAYDKSISMILYVAPDKSLGTSFFRDNDPDTFVKYAKWAPNCASLFCGEELKTWHGSQSMGNEYRMIVAFFIEHVNPNAVDYYMDLPSGRKIRFQRLSKS